MKLTEQEIEALELGIAEDKSLISYLEQRVKALEEALLLVQVLLIHIAAKGHKSGYDWNSDPEYHYSYQ